MDTPGFLIRNAVPKDLPAVLGLARHLNSYNLPDDRRHLKKLIEDSQRSFGGSLSSFEDGRYLFVLEDGAAGQVVGTSLIVAKHGRPGMPHLYMTVFEEARTSATLKKTVRHHCLRLGSTEDGPTELGGLVLAPRYRGRKEKLAAWLSYARLLYIAAHRERFQTCLLAEYMPRFLKGRVSPFWEYLGRKFTGLTYGQADRLSIGNKEFVLSLFPRGTIYLDFFPPDVLKYLGEVGDPSAPAARLLAKAGFHFLQQIEPFDGGPYFGTLTRESIPVQAARQLQCHTFHTRVTGAPRLLMTENQGSVRAMAIPLRFQGTQAGMPVDAARSLALRPGDWFWSAPLL